MSEKKKEKDYQNKEIFDKYRLDKISQEEANAIRRKRCTGCE